MSSERRGYDVAVVGAGPAGLAAAVTAARGGARVALLDAGPRVGGQFWGQHQEGSASAQRAWSVFAGLRASLLELPVDYTADAGVWFVESGRQGCTLHLTSQLPVRTRRLVFATGAYDRALPFPGWELPGVVTPGAAQALWKGSGVAIGSRVVVAGAGPFLLPVAAALLAAGVTVAGVFEAGSPMRYTRRPGPIAFSKLRERAGYAATLAQHRVPYRTRHAVVAARGPSAVSSVEVMRLDEDGYAVPGTQYSVECDAVAVGYGFTPQLELPLAMGCATRLDADGNLVLEVDVAGRTSVSGVYAAGEVTGVGGAELSLIEGQLVGSVAALAAGRPAPFTDAELIRLLDRRAAQRRFAELMHDVHAPPAGWSAWLDEQTVVCRCEEVPVARIRAAVTEWGATDTRSVQSLCRTGMGWCQGRVCGYPTAVLTAQLGGRPLAAADLIGFARRPIARPVSLGMLAAAEPPGRRPPS